MRSSGPQMSECGFGKKKNLAVSKKKKKSGDVDAIQVVNFVVFGKEVLTLANLQDFKRCIVFFKHCLLRSGEILLHYIVTNRGRPHFVHACGHLCKMQGFHYGALE